MCQVRKELNRSHRNKIDQNYLSHIWIASINSMKNYNFYITIFQPWQIRRTRNRYFSWGWVWPANKLIKSPITTYSWEREANRCFKKNVSDNVWWWKTCTILSNLQACGFILCGVNINPITWKQHTITCALARKEYLENITDFMHSQCYVWWTVQKWLLFFLPWCTQQQHVPHASPWASSVV